VNVHKADDPNREVRVQIQRGLVACADRVLITQVLLNLIANAWKFTRDIKDARIDIGANDASDGGRVFFVRDNGPGFDMAQAQRLFAPFVRLHTDESFEGTGIGLATVRKIMERHGGTVWADAAPAAGACFFFALPGAVPSPKGRKARKTH
jgi:signal transduction histidine kinase